MLIVENVEYTEKIKVTHWPPYRHLHPQPPGYRELESLGPPSGASAWSLSRQALSLFYNRVWSPR